MAGEEDARGDRGKEGPGLFTLPLLTREKWIDRPIQSLDIFRSGNPANKSLKENKSADDRGEYFNVRREAKWCSLVDHLFLLFLLWLFSPLLFTPSLMSVFTNRTLIWRINFLFQA